MKNLGIRTFILQYSYHGYEVIIVDFNSVWSRVAGAFPGSADPAELLERFAEDELYACAYYSALASKTRSYTARKLFCALSADESRHARRLCREHFLLTGNCIAPAAGSVSLPPSLLDAVRLRRGEELSAAGRYDRMADAWPERDAAHIFAGLASDERRHASELERLLEKCF